MPYTYKEIGHNKSAGCLRTTSGAAYWIYINCPIGTKVKIVNGSPKNIKSQSLPPLKYQNIDQSDPNYVIPDIKKPKYLTSYSVLGINPDNYKTRILKNNLVNLTEIDKSIVVNLTFSRKNRITKTKLYPANVCFLQYDTAVKLIRANEIFKRKGYRIKIFDGYRPLSSLKKLYDSVENKYFLGNPFTLKSSNHCRGSAVDITLIDKNGLEIEMPSPVYEFNKNAYRNSEMTTKIRSNLNYMTEIMRKCGFKTINCKWWHFFEQNSYDKYPVTDHKFNNLIKKNK